MRQVRQASALQRHSPDLIAVPDAFYLQKSITQGCDQADRMTEKSEIPRKAMQRKTVI
jgi:hypothetical protein